MREYALTILLVAAATYFSTPLIRRFAVRVKAITEVRDRDVHAIPTPRLGGIAMLIGLGVGLFVAAQLPQLAQVFKDTTWIGVLAGGAIVCLVGALDDRFTLDPLTKLAGQVVAAGVMVLSGIQMFWLPLPGMTLGLGNDHGVIITVLLVVAVMNAINFVDGLDGLAAGIAGIAAAAFFSYSWLLSYVNGLERATTPTLVTAILVGMCVGFLPHNFHPAKLFMGDSGSMLIGLLLSAGTITLTGQVDVNALGDGAQNPLPAVLPLLLPVAVLAVPFVDVLLAIVRRTWAGRAPWAPDKLHMHHRLLRIGHSQRRAVLIMYSWAALIGGTVVATAFHGVPMLLLTITAGIGVLALVLVNIPRLLVRRKP
ncbi:MAG: undecaprenyl/decaprenyl-phosphate alpha-N-acetylglucosaminyl 1-phosphate transferase [Streptosporangiales bacterium]|nr:undecaprenyl/decaprenyl-phosphate alpha-N-acetylglucosaminyl 1-phosphate transferase [Streptosporangiales bacterium]